MCDAARFFFLCCLLTGLLPARGADLDENPAFQSALAALRAGQPMVAAAKAELLLADSAWSAAERGGLAGLAAEAWVRAGDGLATLALIEREHVPGAEFWKAQALLLTGRGKEAAVLLEERLQKGEAGDREKLLLAQVSLAGGDAGQAREIAAGLLASPTPETAGPARLILVEAALAQADPHAALEALDGADEAPARALRARALLELGRAPEAAEILRGVIAGRTGGERLIHSCHLLLAEAERDSGRLAEAAEGLITFLDSTPSSELWSRAFDLLGRLLPALDAPPTDAVTRWVVEGGTAQRQTAATAEADVFRGHAMLALARWLLGEERRQEALGLLVGMAQLFPDHPQAGEAMRLALQAHGSQGQAGAVAVLASLWRPRFEEGGAAFLDFVTGSSAFVRGDYRPALDDFLAAADTAATLAARRSALFNACVAALRAGEPVLYQTLLGQLQIVSAGSGAAVKTGDTAADLELDRSLELAAKKQAGAVAGLNAFLENHSSHPRALEACLALAEVAMLSAPPNFSMAEKALSQADVLPELDDERRQRIAVTRLWLLERQGRLAELAGLGADFLKSWPESSYAAEVRMKMAGAHLRLEDHAAARTEFELLAREHPESPYADSALYFAAQSAMAMLTEEGRAAAIEMWQDLYERGGPLAHAALHQLAQARRLAAEEAEALKLVGLLLAAPDLRPDLRRQLTCEKAELLMLLGKSRPQHYEEAVATLRQLLEEKDMPYAWSARAGHTLATVYHAAGRPADALAACHDVVQNTPFGGPANPAEYRWYYRAGFLGIELLEAARQWDAAARMAEMLAASRGERAREAGERATKIRLDHFIWDEKRRTAP